jgi:hypothetical protein
MRKHLITNFVLIMLIAGCTAAGTTPTISPTTVPELVEPTPVPADCDGTCQGSIMAAIDIIDTVGFHGMSEDLTQAALLSSVGPVVGITAAIDLIDSTGFHGMQEEIEAATSFEEVSPRDLGSVQKALWVSMATPWPEALAESVAAFESDAQALVDALTAGDLAAAQEAAAGVHHTQHDLSSMAYEWLQAQTVEAGEGLISAVGVTAAIDLIDSTGFHGLQEEIEAATSFEEISPRNLGSVQKALWVSMAAPWPELLAESVAAFEKDVQALADALTAGDLAAAQEAAAGAHHTQHDLSGMVYEWLAGMNGADLRASLINSRYLGRVQNAQIVVQATPWFGDLVVAADDLAADLQALADALSAGDVIAAAEAADAVHGTQHDLSHSTYEWLSDQSEVATETYSVLAAIDIIDNTGFHAIQEEILVATSFEEVSPRNLGRVENALVSGLVVTWPTAFSTDTNTFLSDAKALLDALTAGDLETSKAAAADVHASQHDLSHAVYHWLGEQSGSANGIGAVISVIDIIDGTGFHGIQEEIEAAQSMEEVSPRDLGRVLNALVAAQLVAWPSPLNEAAQGFITDAQALADALETGDLASAQDVAGDAHHTQHDLSNDVYVWLSDQAGVAFVSDHESSEAVSEHSNDGLHEEYADATIISLEVSDWGWNPMSITLKKGEPIVLEITNVGVMPHGIWIPGLAINVATPAGEVTLVPLTPEEVGEYMMGCSEVMCGTAEQHSSMTTSLIVTE